LFKAISTSCRAVGRAMPGVIADVAGIGGACLISYGAWLIYPPAGFITGGILTLAGVLLASSKARAG